MPRAEWPKDCARGAKFTFPWLCASRETSHLLAAKTPSSYETGGGIIEQLAGRHFVTGGMSLAEPLRLITTPICGSAQPCTQQRGPPA